MKVNFGDCLYRQVFPVTNSLAIGKYATEARAEYLRELGITHVLNVSDAPSVVSPESHGFVEVAHVPMLDAGRVADETAIAALDRLHAMVAQEDSRVYVHCIAGQIRSPTIVWLYLLACGIESEQARRIIADRVLDCAPGHPKLVDAALVKRVQQHGQENFLPHPMPDALTPVVI